MASIDKIEQANKLFGEDVVYEVAVIVEASDPDGAWSMFEEEGLDTHARAVEFIYFDN